VNWGHGAARDWLCEQQKVVNPYQDSSAEITVPETRINVDHEIVIISHRQQLAELIKRWKPRKNNTYE